MDTITKLAEAIKRLRRIRKAEELSQHIYGVQVDVTNKQSTHDAARQVKRMMLDDERLVINHVLDTYSEDI